MSHLIKPILDGTYPKVSYGKGVFLYDEHGKDYLDASSGAVTVSVGHGVQEITDVLENQAKRVSFVYRSQFTSEAAERLAEKIYKLSNGHLSYSFFVNSGTEATETAMKMALQHFQEKGQGSKLKILSRWMSYHGITIGSLSMSGHSIRRTRFVPLLQDYPTVSAPYCYRCPYHMEFPSCQLRCADELERAIIRIGEEHIAAFIAEPIIGAAGAAITPPPGYYERIRDICNRYNILFIADEVMTGLGRTGKMFGYDHWEAKPDIVTLGKGLGAGYTPIAAAVATEEVMLPIKKGSKLVMSGHTFSANPLSCATALSVLQYVEKHNLVDESAQKGAYLKKELLKLKERFSIIGDVRGEGLLLGVEFVEDKKTKEPFPTSAQLTNQIIQTAMQNGLLLYPSAAGIEGVRGDAVIISPPFTIKEGEIKELLCRFEKTLSSIEMRLKNNPEERE
ncbi:aspartate aminotransferase family protein [Priestia endophytica]|uniref:aspartate aminotransferase family protein n=1 Tax=Priestia endophytica TaxID=135735 RepID=UPI002041A6EC|nr:aspartate aminotransferase family protein [Priestia endophytica]MCM3537069.1 aspartate aminotransferase family protein [Priestia endophytica]